MRAFIITSLVLACIGLLARLGCLSWSTYPRMVSNSRGDDALHVLVAASWIGWAAYLLIR